LLPLQRAELRAFAGLTECNLGSIGNIHVPQVQEKCLVTSKVFGVVPGSYRVYTDLICRHRLVGSPDTGQQPEKLVPHLWEAFHGLRLSIPSS
jgi:hypothetical protein